MQLNKAILSFLILVTAEAKIGNADRELSFERFQTFTPITNVADHAAIDLDQQEIEDLVAGDSPKYGAAQKVYENGAHSKAYAVLTVSGLSTSLSRGAAVSGKAVNGDDITGTIYEDASSGATSIKVQYHVTGDQASNVGCQVGGSAEPVTDGCFAATGSLEYSGSSISYTQVENKNGRTIQGFSTGTSKHRVNGEGEFYKDFDMFQEYYGTTKYADEWVLAAISKSSTQFSNGNANFQGSADEARVEAIKKGSVYMNIFMYVIRELEDSIDDCNANCDREECNDDAVSALDEAVAFYTGSLVRTEGGDGNLLWALAQKRCVNFATCEGTIAAVNSQIFTLFNRMQDNLQKKDCRAATNDKNAIANLMYVPMIQGTLRYGYFSDVRNDQTEKSEAEGATFAAAVLPKVASCSPRDAEIIYDNLKIGNTSPADFKAIKAAFERNYGCMGITCEDVGGLSDGDKYFAGANPCSGSFLLNVGLVMGMATAAVFALL